MVEVYHVTTPENAEKCLVEGLVPYKATQAHPDTLKNNTYYDLLRPDYIAVLGISRSGSIYAHVNPQNAVDHHNGSWLRLSSVRAYLEISVDPREVYIADMQLFGEPYSPRDYWGSIMSLQFYLHQMRQGRKAPTFFEQDNDSNYHMRVAIHAWPEVLIPNGVEPAQIRLMDSSELPEPSTIYRI